MHCLAILCEHLLHETHVPKRLPNHGVTRSPFLQLDDQKALSIFANSENIEGTGICLVLLCQFAVLFVDILFFAEFGIRPVLHQEVFQMFFHCECGRVLNSLVR